MLSRNTSTSSNIMEQKDVIRSILILQQQQQRLNPYPHSNNARRSTNRVRDQMNGIGGSSRDVNEDSSISSFIAEPLTAHAGSHSDTTPAREQLGQDARRPDEIKQNQTNSTTDAENTILDDAVSPPSGDPSRATSGTKSNDRASRRSSLEIQADARIEELRTYSVYPDLTASFAKVQVTWSWSESRIPESNIRHRLAKNEADGLAPVFDVLEALHTYERPIVDRALDWVQGINPAYRVNLMGLKRTEQDMQHGSIVFKAVPCFNLIVKLDCHPSRQPTAESNHIVSMIVDPPWVKDLSRPTYIKVHRKHLSPDTLDEYDLPWEWDKVSTPVDWIDNTVSLYWLSAGFKIHYYQEMGS